MLVREGVSGGATPSLQVFEIGTLSNKRHPSDILPFLPAFRHLFNPLPTKSSQMTSKVCRVALSDLECVTNTMVKLSGPLWYLNIRKGMYVYWVLTTLTTTEAVKFADKELSKFCSSWTSNAWDEMDWARIKELQVRDVLEQRQAQADIAQRGKCLQCPQFLKHVSSLSG